MGDTEVVVTDETDPPVVEDAPDVVVVDTGSDGGDGNDYEQGQDIGQLQVAVAGLAASVDGLIARVDMAESNAQFAWDMAAQAQETAVEAVVEAEVAVEEAEEAAEEVEEVIEPDREHPLWRRPVRFRRHDHD